MDAVTTAVIENRGIRCGNHGKVKVYHFSIQDVRDCFAETEYEKARAQEAPRIRGWWNLPIAASMWAADARDIER